MKKEQLRKNWRRGFAIALTAAMVANSALPSATAFAAEFTSPDEIVQTLPENTTEDVQTKEESVVFGDDGESAEDIFSTGTENASSAQAGEAEFSETAEALQERINALPTVEEFKAMADGTTVEESTLSRKQYDVYMEAESIAEAYEQLSEEEKQLVDATKMETLFEYFNDQIDSTSDNVVVHAAKNGQNSIRVDYTVNEWSSWSWQEDIGWIKWVLLDKNIGTDADVIAGDYLARHGAVSSGEKMVEKFLKNDGISICKRFDDDYKRISLGSSSYDILDVSSLGAYNSGKYYIYMLAMLGKNACNYPYAFAGTIKTGNGKILFRADGNDTADTGWTVLNGYEMNLNSDNLEGARANVSPKVIVPDSGQTATVTITPDSDKRFVNAPTVTCDKGHVGTPTLVDAKSGVYTCEISDINSNATITVSGEAIKHKHQWKYRTVTDRKGNSNVIEVYCGNEDATKVLCQSKGEVGKLLTLNALNSPYPGKGNHYNKASITYENLAWYDGIKPDAAYIKYYTNGIEMTGAPTDQGYYVAKITLGEATASKRFSITKATIGTDTVKVPTIDSKTYTGENLTADIQETDLYRVETNEGGVDAGYYKVTLGLKDPYNYKWENGGYGDDEEYIDLTFEITKKPVTVTAKATKSEITYGDSVPDLTYDYTDLGSGVALKDIEVSYDAEAVKDAGTYTITAKEKTAASNPNYDINFKPGQLKINKKTLTVKPTADQTKIYGEKDPEFAYTIEESELANGDKADDILKELTGTLGREKGEDAGEYAFTLGTLGGLKNYELSVATENVPKFQIKQKSLTDDMIVVNIKKDANGKDYAEVTASDAGKLKTSDYTVTTDLNSDPYVVTVNGKGNYSGTIVRKITVVKTPENNNTVSTAVIEDGTTNDMQASLNPVSKKDAEGLLNDNLTDEGTKNIINGTTPDSSYDATVYLKRKELAENAITNEPEKIKKAIADGEIPSNSQIAKCIDLHLLMNYVAKANNLTKAEGTVQITDAGKYKQSVIATIPAALKQTSANMVREFYVVRISGDEVKKVDSSVSGDTITFTFDKSATYVLVYKDTPKSSGSTSYPVTGVSVSSKKTTLTKAGETTQITATVKPAYADNKNVTWKSSNEKVATVDKNGKVTAVGNGTATITATTVSGNYTAKVTVTVNIPEEKPAIDKITMTLEKKNLTKIGESTQINLKIEPENADSSDLIWKSSDEKVAVVDKNGKVTAVGNGTVTITVSTKDGKYTASVTITVKVADEPTPDATTGYGRLKARSVTQTNNSVKVEWTRVEGADGYIVYGNRCNGNGKVYKYQKLTTITNGKTRSWIQTGLKKGTYYKYIVKAYKVVNGKKVITDTSVSVHAVTTGGKYGVAKSVSVTKIGNKKNTLQITLKTGKTAQITAKEVKKNKPIRHHRNLCYETSNSKVAAVTPDGMIQATGKGTCTIWVYAQNGVYKAITVTVK